MATAALAGCPAGADGSACRSLLNYTAGYIFQQQARTSGDADRAGLMKRAEQAYRGALQDDPGNATIHFNLALLLEAAGRTGPAALEVQQAARLDPQQWLYLVKLGDLQVQQKQWAEALQSYELAAKTAPGAEAPPARIIDLARHGQGLRPSELMSRCRQWEALFPSLTTGCYEQVIATAGDDQALSENTVAAWLSLVARQEQVTPDLLERLPSGYNPSVTKPLAMAMHGELPANAANWWTQRNDRSEAWARFLLALGEQESAAAPEKAERIWQYALVPVREDPRSASSLELRRALALLYVRQPRLDANGAKLHELVQRIFESKMGAIQSKDLEAEQKYHAVLGLIFAGQKNWGNDGDAYSALFQLRRTVEVANERFQREGIYQPLPEIKALRVKAYQQTGRTTQAAQAQWDTALAYMDTDQLDLAGKAIEAVPPSPAFNKQALLALLQTRMQAGSATPQKTSQLITNLSSVAATQGISKEFLQRQQFKALADIAAADDGKGGSDSVRAALDAFSLTVDQRVPLVGVNDLGRWQVVQQKVVQSVGARSEKMQVRPGGGAATLKLALPGSTVPQNVVVSTQTIQAAHVARVLGPETVAQYRGKMVLSDGKLVVPHTAANDPGVRQKLESTGVKVTAVR
jgi:tetratricopeptide (TPR) repeat protein